jgi:hypothetical protein
MLTRHDLSSNGANIVIAANTKERPHAVPIMQYLMNTPFESMRGA